MSFSSVWTFDTANGLTFDSTKVAIVAGAIQLSLSPYTLTPQLITTQHQIAVTQLNSVSGVSSQPTGTVIQGQVVLAGVPYWWNSLYSKWQVSDGTFLQSNTLSVINAHASTLMSDLNILTNQFLSINQFLSTTDVTATPIRTSITIGYTWVNSTSTAMNQCVISANLADLAGNVPVSANPAMLLVSSPFGFFHGTNFIEPFTKVFQFSGGAVAASVIETASPGVKLRFAVTFWNGQSITTVQLFNAVVPNVPSIPLSQLSSQVPYDFG